MTHVEVLREIRREIWNVVYANDEHRAAMTDKALSRIESLAADKLGVRIADSMSYCKVHDTCDHVAHR